MLLEGVPGVAKTLLVRAVAKALAIDTKRVQFTPDLMPGDVTGSLVYDDTTSEFAFREGPVFTNLLLADEINRTPPKTQAALLEAMEERQVSVDGTPRPLPDPFLVAATQNPVEYEGTYPLPEAQLDRFLLKLVRAAAAARATSSRCSAGTPSGFDPRDLDAAGLRPVAGPDDLAAGREAVVQVTVAARGERRTSSTWPGHPVGAVALARRVPPWCDRAAGDLARVGVADRPRLRHPRRRQGARPRHARAPTSRCGRRPSSRASRPRSVLGQRHRLRAGPPLRFRMRPARFRTRRPLSEVSPWR